MVGTSGSPEEIGQVTVFDVAMDHVTLAHESSEVEFNDQLELAQFGDPELKIYLKCPADSGTVHPRNVQLLSVSIEDWASKSVSSDEKSEKVMREYLLTIDGQAFAVTHNSEGEVRYARVKDDIVRSILREIDRAQMQS